MRYVVFDFEVFCLDWVVVFEDVKSGEVVTIHNNAYEVKEFLRDRNIMLCGFNSKGYDNWILLAILEGADNETVKALNDFIIVQRKNGWDFPFLRYKKRPFTSLDLKDDLAKSLSLKAIEGNMGHSIVESSVDFRLNRKLTDAELQEVIEYCKTDVRNTTALFHARKKYIDSKRQVARIKGMSEVDAVQLTNAKLTARFLDATKLRYTDELVYEVPRELNIGKYTHVLEFFLDPVTYTLNDLKRQLETETRKIKIRSLTRKIQKLEASNDRYDCELKTMIAGVLHVFAWGGIHGAIKNLVVKECPGYIMLAIDVGSYYPSMMLKQKYLSRSVPSALAYAEMYETRMNAKHSGDSETADALKLIANTTYGAMKNQYNDLFDPRMASAICITGQLFLTDLIDKLEVVSGFSLLQSNTDGIIIRIPEACEDEVHAIVSEWESRTLMNMEYTITKSLVQKDVNNYVMKSGETYLIKDKVKQVTKADKNKIKTKGGYVSMFEGGDFNNNSLVVVQRALVRYFMDEVPLEQTIKECTNILDFQMIAKTGSTYDGTFWEVDGERVPVQKVNRVYAIKNTRYGTIKKVKGGKDSDIDVSVSSDDDAEERVDKIASLPEHSMIDNENRMTINDLDLEWYIALANKRVIDYVGKNAPTEETKKENVKMPVVKNVYAKLIEARKRFLDLNVKKSGVNRFAEFDYFELKDIVPPVTEIFMDLGLIMLTTFEDEHAIGTVVNTDNPDDRTVFMSPMRTLNIVSQSGKNKMNELQGLGSEETYQRRYLYLMAMDIVENDTIDATIGSDEGVKAAAPKASKKPVTPDKRADIKKELIGADGTMTAIQEKSLKTGLKKLIEKDNSFRDYVNETVVKMKAGLTKKQAEDLLIEVGEKVEG